METIGSAPGLGLEDKSPDFPVSFSYLIVPFPILKVGVSTVGKVWWGVGEKCCPSEFLEVPENSRFHFLVNTAWGRRRGRKARKICHIFLVSGVGGWVGVLQELIREEPLNSISSSIRLRAMNVITDFR